MIQTEIKLPNREKVASFDVDCQKTFTPLCPEELPVSEGHLIIPELNAQAQKARWRLGSKEAHHREAIWVATKEKPILTPLDHLNADTAWPVHAVPGTIGFELLDGLPHPTEYDFFVWKGIELDLHPYGGCFHDLQEKLSTGVIEFLKLHRISTIIVGGLALDYCVKTTVLQLLKAEFQVIVNLAATRGVAPETTKEAVKMMQRAGAIFVTNAEALLGE